MNPVAELVGAAAPILIELPTGAVLGVQLAPLIPPGASQQVLRDAFIGAGPYLLSAQPSPESLVVFVNGLYAAPDEYLLSGQQLSGLLLDAEDRLDALYLTHP